MITTSELLQLMSLLISVAGLFYLIGKDNHGRKNNRPGQCFCYFYITHIIYAKRLSAAPFYFYIIP